MEALERVKLEGFDMVLAELQVELKFLAGPRGIWRSDRRLLTRSASKQSSIRSGHVHSHPQPLWY